MMDELEQPAPQSCIDGDVGYLPLTTRSGRLVAWAKVDAEALPRLAGRPWRLTASGYAGRCERRDSRRVTALLGREVIGIGTGGPRVVHRNGDKLDCRRSNLRWSRRWLTRKLEGDDDLAAVLLKLARESKRPSVLSRSTVRTAPCPACGAVSGEHCVG